jgi:hypothetical protein
VHAIQASLPEVAGQGVIGGRIAATRAAGQAHIQVDGPLAVRLQERFVAPVVASLALAGNRMRATCAWEFQPPSSMPERGRGTRLALCPTSAQSLRHGCASATREAHQRRMRGSGRRVR